MTAYTTRDAVRLALAPIMDGAQDQDADAGGLDDTQVDDAIAEASSRIDTYLSQRYQTPVAPLDPLADPPVYADPLPYWCRDFAAYLLSLTYFRSSAMNTTEPIYIRYRDVIAELVAVRDGKQLVNLPPVTTGPTRDSQGSGVVDPGMTNVFDVMDTGYPARPLPGRGGISWGTGYGW